MQTEKLYDNDAYATEFTAAVLSCEPTANGEKKSPRYAVVLDRTLFFPEEGGQTPDNGVLLPIENDTPATDPIPVLDVQISDGVITHFCDTPLVAGTSVRGTINWAHRYSNMQQHTGEHIFSGVVHEALGYDNVGFHLSDNIVTMDYNGPISDEQLEAFETKANEWIYKNVPVTACYPSEEDLASIDYRSKSGITGAVRIVTVEGCDVCACCAPHVARTGEVGILKVVDRTPYKGGIRLSILCGLRALNDYRAKQEILNGLSRLLSKPQDELIERTNALLAERDDLKQQLYLAKKEQLDAMAAAVPSSQNNVCLFISSCDMNLARKTVNALTETHKGFCMIAVGTDTDGYSFILGSAEGKANEAAQLLRKELSAKCGGSDAMIQGSIQASEKDIRQFLLNAEPRA